MVSKQEVLLYSLKNKRFGYLQDKCMEEMTEFMKEVFKARERGLEYTDEIGMEFGDAELMMEQIKYCYDFATNGQFSKQVEYYKQRKCDKLWDIWHDPNLVEKNEKC